jgi:hypothetical protein
MKDDVSALLDDAVALAVPRLLAIDDAAAARSRGEGKWVAKEILGHLIDSAVNNHQRFVRARFADEFVGPGYDQEAWVELHGYRERAWTDLVVLWAGLNQHVAHAMRSVPADRYAMRCVVGGEAETLEWWMRDYVRHLRHHLAQILGA